MNSSTIITPIHLSYLSGITSNIQNQLDLLSPLNSPTFITGSPKAPLHNKIEIEPKVE